MLPRYAKGRKGGKGTLAWVGEQGPELQWIPDGASIIPAHKSKNLTPGVMREYSIDIPQLPVMPQLPTMPNVRIPTADRAAPLSIDYDKLGRAVADNVKMPEIKQLNIALDENGYTKHIVRSSGKTKFLNTRFCMN